MSTPHDISPARQTTASSDGWTAADTLAEILAEVDATIADPESAHDGDRLCRNSKAGSIAAMLAQLSVYVRLDCSDDEGAALLERMAREYAALEATVL